MMRKRNILLGILLCIGIVASNAFTSKTNLPSPFDEDVETATQNDTIPLKPRYGDFINNGSSNPFDLNEPSDVKQEVEYDPVTGNYIISERIGEEYYRMPTYLTFEEYLEYRRKQQETAYFQELSGVATGKNGLDGDDPLSKIDLENTLSDRLFGGSGVDIQVQGNIDMFFGLSYQETANPAWPLRQQRQGPLFLFRFDDLQMNVDGQIGDKLNFSTNYNAQATFDFDNQMKLEYASDAFSEDDIIKTIEAGNVSLPLQGTLIQGAQNLFGLKTQLQFGHLYITAIASQQKSEREQIEIKGGSEVREFQVGADEYDVNRHFFLSHYNRAVFEKSLENIPQISGLFTVQQIEVWVTNDRSVTPDDRNRAPRDIVALTDLGEGVRITSDKVSPSINPVLDIDNLRLPDSTANTLYLDILNSHNVDNIEDVARTLRSKGLKQAIDFEKTQARMLREGQDYTVDRQLGFISLNINLQPYQTLGVAYRYSYNGEMYGVGQLSKNQASVSNDGEDQKVLFVKMLKGTTPNVDQPLWDLMMKNIYNIGAYQVDREDFRLDIYYEDPGNGQRRFIPDTRVGGQPLLQVFNLDQLNSRLDPQRDGAFDFVPGLTIYPRTGRIMFPKLEPFGDYLRNEIMDDALAQKYVYDELYDKTITFAREFPERNRFTIKGRYRSSISSEISLGAFNIPPGSVIVTGPGGRLIEGQDYEIDYNIGRIKILRDDILASGQTIRVSFEDNTLFGLQTKTMLGLRADYKPGENFNLGATYMHLFERPLTQKVNIGDDPINNKIYGLDLSFTKDAPWITRAIDNIPLIDTKAPSSISFFAEAAALKPGHSRAVNEVLGTDENDKPIVDKSGSVYLDDFEGSANPISLMIQPNQWQIASVPQGAEVYTQDGTHKMFRESDALDVSNNRLVGVNRAHLNWYRIFPEVRGLDPDGEDNPYTARIDINEVFPNRQNTPDQLPTLQTFDLYYNPKERGAYNYDIPGNGTEYSAGLDSIGGLKEPATRWGGIMRDLRTINDFERSNVEYIELWVLSPFLEAQRDEMEGDLYIELGNVSEDILRDSRKFFENGLPSPTNPNREVDQTDWGNVPRSRQIVNAFDNDPSTRPAQDVGLDGMNNAEEYAFFKPWLDELQAGGIDITDIEADPSNDDFRFYLDYDDNATLQTRYSRFNKTQGNTPIAEAGATRARSATLLPDTEDLNNDQTLSETESYFQYHIPIRKRSGSLTDGIGMSDEGNNYITDERIIRDDAGGIERIWYRMKIPLDEYTRAVGGIQDFRSIRFVRMYMAGFEEDITLRFARFDLVRNQWRRYRQDLEELNADEGTLFDVNAVNIEENGERLPFNYVLPEGITREQNLGPFTALQNEQSLALTARNLQHRDSRSIYKNINFDMRNYERVKMFVHAENLVDSLGNNECMTRLPENGDLSIFMRIGSDFKQNYYEYEIPITFSEYLDPPARGEFASAAYSNEVWREENDFDVPLEWFVLAKKAAIEAFQNKTINTDSLSFPSATIPTPEGVFLPAGHRLSVAGRPNLGYVKSIMIGIRNTSSTGEAHCGEVWINELRLAGLNEQGGYAATARMDIQLADFGALSASTTYNSVGFGALDQRLQERALDETLSYDMAANFQLGKFLPKKSGIQLPFYAAYSNTTVTPKFDPYDLDIELDDKLAEAAPEEREAIRESAITRTEIKNYSFTNVRKERSSKEKKNGKKPKPMPWDISNFSATYSYAEEVKSDPIIKENKLENTRGILDYNYSRRPNYIKPFEKLPKSDWLKFLRDMNFNPFPNSVSFSTVLDRRQESITYRFTEEFEQRYQTYLNKQFTWDRSYGVSWDFAKALKITFDANNYGVIDELDESSDAFYEQIPFPSEEDLVRQRRDRLVDGFQSFGRTKNYDHNLNVNFTVPTKLFPILDWTNIRAQYSADYGWTAASLNVEELGNIIQNGQKRQVTADFNFEQLYNKSDYLKKINRRRRGGSRSGAKPRPSRDNSKLKKDGEEDAKKKKKKREPSATERAFIRPLMFIRKARFNYSEQSSTIVPGFMPQTELLGMTKGFGAPGLNFVTGWQPTIRTLAVEDYGTGADWLHTITNGNGAKDSWISGDVLLNNEVIQKYTQTVDAKLSLEPIPEFRIEIDASSNFTENHTQFFKNTNTDPNAKNQWFHAIPRNVGSFETTFLSLQTLFDDDLSQIIETFSDFKRGRATVSQNLGTPIPYSAYADGYGRGQQDILIPAFLAVYTGKDPDNVDVSGNYARDILFRQFPLPNWRPDTTGTDPLTKVQLPFPNWRITYNGLAKLPFFEDIFQQVGISHAYTSKLGINMFRTDLDFLDNPLGRDQQNNFFSRLEIPEVQIREAFSPLIGLEVQTKNDISLSLQMNKNRTLSTDFQGGFISEQQATDITFGFGWLMENVEIGFLQRMVNNAANQNQDKADTNPNQQNSPFGNNRGGSGGANPGDLNITFDFSLRDDVTIVHELETENREPTRGTRSISIAPSMEYQVHEQLAIRLFVDYSKTIPKVSSSYPITSARGGLVIRFMLQ